MDQISVRCPPQNEHIDIKKLHIVMSGYFKKMLEMPQNSSIHPYIHHVLRAHGLPQQSLNDVYRATVQGKFYMLPQHGLEDFALWLVIG